jgi:hypothetical protein
MSADLMRYLCAKGYDARVYCYYHRFGGHAIVELKLPEGDVYIDCTLGQGNWLVHRPTEAPVMVITNNHLQYWAEGHIDSVLKEFMNSKNEEEE